MKKQKGISLVSTMIGLLLGVLSILAMMMLYRTLVHQSVVTNIYVKEDTETQSALLSAQMQMQKAGYGIEAATNSCLGATVAGPSATANTDFILLNNASLSGNTLTGTKQTIANAGVLGNAVVYRWIESGTSMCSGMISTANGVNTLLPTACTSANDYATTNWTPYALTGPKSNVAGIPISFSAIKLSSCNLYGKTSTGPAVGLTITGTRNISALGETSTTLCLPNICQ